MQNKDNKSNSNLNKLFVKFVDSLVVRIVHDKTTRENFNKLLKNASCGELYIVDKAEKPKGAK